MKRGKEMRTATVTRSDIHDAIVVLNIGRLSFKRIAQNDTDYTESERENATAMQIVYAEEMRELFALRNSCTDGNVTVETESDDNSANGDNVTPETENETIPETTVKATRKK